MKALLTSYADIMTSQKEWSWTIVAILFLILGLWIRGIFLKPIIRRAKTLDKKYYREFRSVYLKRSIPGWLFFALSLILLCVLWIQPWQAALNTRQIILLIALVVSYGISILFHLMALGIGAVLTLKSTLGMKDVI